MGHPYKIESTYNEEMKAFDLHLMVGGVKDRAELDSLAKALAEFVAGTDGYVERVGTADH